MDAVSLGAAAHSAENYEGPWFYSPVPAAHAIFFFGVLESSEYSLEYAVYSCTCTRMHIHAHVLRINVM